MAAKNPPPTKEQFIQHLRGRGVSEERAKRLADEAERQGLLAKAQGNPTKGLRRPSTTGTAMAGTAKQASAGKQEDAPAPIIGYCVSLWAFDMNTIKEPVKVDAIPTKGRRRAIPSQ